MTEPVLKDLMAMASSILVGEDEYAHDDLVRLLRLRNVGH